MGVLPVALSSVSNLNRIVMRAQICSTVVTLVGAVAIMVANMPSSGRQHWHG